PLQQALAALRQPAVWVALAALALAGWQWFDARARQAELQQEVARRLAAGDAASGEARALSKQNQEALAALQAKTGVLEAKLAESQSQQAALDAMVQELTRNRDERLLAEIEQALNTASQQLQLAGNVEAALIALQGADARLVSAGRAQFLPLRKVIARDIDRLKALPLADAPGIALRIEGIVGAIDAMPLAYEAKPRIEPAQGSFVPATTAGTWEKLLGELWRELKSLIRIERLDRPDPALLSPSHAFFLRENLKLRLVNARLSLLQRDGKSFRQDIRQAQEWIERYFDTRARPVQAALATLKQLAAADVGAVLPSLQESLTTLRNFKIAREGAAAQARDRDAR
ncbi:MAG: uroporphyrinogen-III C-methyltransferase, partial [Rhodocyclaceae bacterium]|nr:uroporphyrinogen-III C-methyltransferase [Rhodocyclaceae bacterium]